MYVWSSKNPQARYPPQTNHLLHRSTHVPVDKASLPPRCLTPLIWLTSSTLKVYHQRRDSCVLWHSVPLHKHSSWSGCPGHKWPTSPGLLSSRTHRAVTRSSHNSPEILFECHILGLLKQVLQADLCYSHSVPCVGHSSRLGHGRTWNSVISSTFPTPYT